MKTGEDLLAKLVHDIILCQSLFLSFICFVVVGLVRIMNPPRGNEDELVLSSLNKPMGRAKG